MSLTRISSANDEDPPTKSPSLPAANNQFALSFLKTIEAMKPGNNHFVSPFSIETALLMTMEGARNKTAKEMGDTLGLPSQLALPGSASPWDLTEIRQEISALLERFQPQPSATKDQKQKQRAKLQADLEQESRKVRSLVQAGKFSEVQSLQDKVANLANQINDLNLTLDSVDLRIANGVWADKSSEFVPEFIDVVQKYYHAQVKNVDFKNAYEQQRTLINQWVSEQTENKIQDLIPAGAVDAMTRMVLANAIYFRGTWLETFKESATKPADFYSRGKDKVSTPMMNHFCERARYGAFRSDGSLHVTPTKMKGREVPQDAYPSDGFQVVELFYNGGELSMIILLPTQRDGLGGMMRSISSGQIDSCLEQLELRNVQVSIPKFKLESQYDLRATLEKMGMVTPFDINGAEFPGMSPEPLFISKVLHKSFVEVNEEGTEAAAATAVIMAPRSAAPSPNLPFVPKFIADHPFLFLIRHNPTGIHLFLGKLETV